MNSLLLRKGNFFPQSPFKAALELKRCILKQTLTKTPKREGKNRLGQNYNFLVPIGVPSTLRRRTPGVMVLLWGWGVAMTLTTCLSVASLSEPCQLYLEFPSGLPSKYYPGQMLLNFSVRMGTGASNMVCLFQL